MKANQFFQTLSALLLLSSTFLQAQNHLEVAGKVKITVMDKDNTADSVVVRQADGALAVRDISTLSEFPVFPTLNGSLGIGSRPNSVYVSGRYAYVVDQVSNDLKVIDVSDPSAPTLIGDLGIGSAPKSIYVSGRYAYVVDGGSDDLKVIDVSDPSEPTLIGNLGIGSAPASISVSGHHAYVVDEVSDDLKVIDVSDPSAPKQAGSLAIEKGPTSVYVSGRYAYVVDAVNEELKVIDVSDPSVPVLAGSLGIGSSPRSIYVSGRYAYVVDGVSEDLKVIDVSDPSVPVLAGSLGIGSGPSSVYVSGRYAYVVDEGSDDLKVIDVSDPGAPILAGSLGIGTTPLSVYVSGNYAYVVDLGSDDLKVIHVSGGEYTSLVAHSLEAGNLQVRNDIIAQGQVQVTGGLNVGLGGIFSDGDLAVNGLIESKNLIVKDDSQIATFQASGNNAFVKLETNGGTAGTSVGYYDDSTDKYFFVDTPEGSFGELVVLADGKVGMGELSPTHPLQMASGAHCTAAGVWTDASDISKKYNIIPLEYGLKEMLQLRPMSYNYKVDDSASIGFIAQEVEKIIPEIVSGKDGSKGIGYGQLNAVLVNAIKEQQNLITNQQSELRLHQHQLGTQKAQIDELKKQVSEFDQLKQELSELMTLVKAQIVQSFLEE